MADTTTDFQRAKRVVRDYHTVLDAASHMQDITKCMQTYIADDYIWRGVHPFHQQTDAHWIAEHFWYPLKTHFTKLQRRPDIFFAGLNEIDEFESTWVVEMGHFMGLFDTPWLGIPATGKMAFIRYAQFHRVQDDKICETTMHIDIPMVMAQVGVNPFPNQTGAFFVHPGPITHDGILYQDYPDKNITKITLDAIHRMIHNVTCGRENISLDGLGDAWHDHMIWFGPNGIGATYTKERYQKQHRKPLVKNMDFNVQGGASIGHIARLAEGKFGGFFGWPNFRAIPTGGFMGLPKTHIETEWRVIDIYHVMDGKIAENWVFIDLLHFMNMQGVNILDRLQQTTKAHAYTWTH